MDEPAGMKVAETIALLAGLKISCPLNIKMSKHVKDIPASINFCIMLIRAFTIVYINYYNIKLRYILFLKSMRKVSCLSVGAGNSHRMSFFEEMSIS